MTLLFLPRCCDLLRDRSQWIEARHGSGTAAGIHTLEPEPAATSMVWVGPVLEPRNMFQQLGQERRNAATRRPYAALILQLLTTFRSFTYLCFKFSKRFVNFYALFYLDIEKIFEYYMFSTCCMIPLLEFVHI